LFKLETLDLTAKSNENLLNHHKKVTAIVVGRKLAETCPVAVKLKRFFTNHYSHPTSDNEVTPAILFSKPPQYYNEIVNTEMCAMLDQVQLDFLDLQAELIPNKEAYLEDLKLIQNFDCETSEREDAEKRVAQACLEAGEYIGHGDLLTFERFFLAKRSRKGSATALERLEYIRYFRVELFHLKMNKTFDDYKAAMKTEVNIDDVLTLGWFKGALGKISIIKNIYNILDISLNI
jgi:hypothetical protein